MTFLVLTDNGVKEGRKRERCAGKTKETEARARYTTAAIAGGIMLLSDDFSNELSRERAEKFTANREINRIASSGIPFRPVESAGGSSGHVFTAVIDDRPYAAMFNWNETSADIAAVCERAQIPEGTYRDLWTGRTVSTEQGSLIWRFEDTDAALLEFIYE